ncbi:hypothetical protein ACFO3J_10820 [Streptomyces polygonati]|uniref:Uncharacterized protein n=1 Tax=Streptomyces polygonati TaxID=1617087 RepID=A0ABV8HIV9_9ACTN
MTDQLFSDPEHVEPVRAPGARPSSDPFQVLPPAETPDAPDTPAQTAPAPK